MKALGLAVSASFSVVLVVTCCQPQESSMRGASGEMPDDFQAAPNHKASEGKTADADERLPIVSREGLIRRAKTQAAETGDEAMRAVSPRGPIDTGISKADLEEEAKRALESLEKSRNARDEGHFRSQYTSLPEISILSPENACISSHGRAADLILWCVPEVEEDADIPEVVALRLIVENASEAQEIALDVGSLWSTNFQKETIGEDGEIVRTASGRMSHYRKLVAFGPRQMFGRRMELQEKGYVSIEGLLGRTHRVYVSIRYQEKGSTGTSYERLEAIPLVPIKGDPGHTSRQEPGIAADLVLWCIPETEEEAGVSEAVALCLIVENASNAHEITLDIGSLWSTRFYREAVTESGETKTTLGPTHKSSYVKLVTLGPRQMFGRWEELSDENHVSIEGLLNGTTRVYVSARYREKGSEEVKRIRLQAIPLVPIKGDPGHASRQEPGIGRGTAKDLLNSGDTIHDSVLLHEAADSDVLQGESEQRQARKVPMGISVTHNASRAWPYLAFGFAGGTAAGAVGFWLLLRRNESGGHRPE